MYAHTMSSTLDDTPEAMYRLDRIREGSRYGRFDGSERDDADWPVTLVNANGLGESTA